jgi:hypothetical protein
MVVHAVIPATQEVDLGGLLSKASWAKAWYPVWKTNESKKGIAQVVEHFPSKHKVWFQTPVLKKKKQSL